LWTACLTGERNDLESLVSPLIAFLNESPDRTPLTDWFDTKTAKRVGFTARPVVGGLFMPMLFNDSAWKKWAALDKLPPQDYAAAPKPPIEKPVLPTAELKPQRWKYTTTDPGTGWIEAEFDDATWSSGFAGFGRPEGHRLTPRTDWSSEGIWLRRRFSAKPPGSGRLMFRWRYDEDPEVYINGVLAARTSGYTTGYELTPLTAEAAAALRPTDNVIAVRCRNSNGGQFIDVGLVAVEPAKSVAQETRTWTTDESFAK
jgi:hypothetical protein